MNKEYVQIMIGSELKDIVSRYDHNKIEDNGLYSICIDYNNIPTVRAFKITHGIEIECNKEIKNTLKRKLPPNLKMNVKPTGIDRFTILFFEDGSKYIEPIATAVINNDGSIMWEYSKQNCEDKSDSTNV